MGPFAGRGVLGGRQAMSTAMEAAMSTLADIICEFPLIRERASFVLIPGEGGEDGYYIGILLDL